MKNSSEGSSLRRSATAGIAWAFSQQFSVQGISFVVSIVLARILLPSDFGLIGMVSVFIALGQSLIDSGLTQSLIRSKEPDQEDYSTVFFFNLAGSILIYLAVFISAPHISQFYDQSILTDIIRVYCLTFIINAFSTVHLTRLTKLMDFRTQLLVSIPSIIVSGVLGIILAYCGFGVWSLVWMSLFQAILNSIQLWFRVRWMPNLVFRIDKFRHHFNFGYKLTLSGLLDTIFKNIYQVIIGKMFLPSQVGFYARADSLKRLPVTNISNALNKVTFPLFASIQNDDERLKRAYQEIMQMVIFIISPILVFMGILAEPLFRFLFTEKWLPAVPYFQILCISGILVPIHSYNLNVLKVKGRSDLFLRLEIIKKIIVVLTILISLRFGIIGLIWGQLVSSVCAFFVNTYYTGKFLNYSAIQQCRDILPPILLSFFSGIVIWSILVYGPLDGIGDFYVLLVLSVAAAVVYIGLATLLRFRSIRVIRNFFEL